MILNHELLKALIETCQWSDKVAELMGPEWDNDGRQLVDFIWGKFYDKYGEAAMEMIGEFIAKNKSSFRTEDYQIKIIHTSMELMEVLEKYCHNNKEK